MSSMAKITHPRQQINSQILPQPCPHLVEFLSNNGSKPFRALQDCLRVKPSGGHASICHDPNEVPQCGTYRKFARQLRVNGGVNGTYSMRASRVQSSRVNGGVDQFRRSKVGGSAVEIFIVGCNPCCS
ncbi:hypothetical protein PS1_007729 [Malus domestica]